MDTLTRKLRVRAGVPAIGLSIAVAVAAALPVRAGEETVVVAQKADANPAPAEHKASKQESIGVVTGLVVGAVAGGPIGAVVGGAAGGWLGDRYHRQELAKQSLAQSLDKSEAERSQLAQSVVKLNGTLHDAESDRGKLAAALERGQELATEVSFRTADASLTEAGTARLKSLASFASGMPGVKIRVCGYADPRGSKTYNLELSRARAEVVAGVLRDAGIPAERLIVEAHGAEDSTSAAGDLDGYALERRVSVSLTGGESGALALAN